MDGLAKTFRTISLGCGIIFIGALLGGLIATVGVGVFAMLFMQGESTASTAAQFLGSLISGAILGGQRSGHVSDMTFSRETMQE